MCRLVHRSPHIVRVKEMGHRADFCRLFLPTLMNKFQRGDCRPTLVYLFWKWQSPSRPTVPSRTQTSLMPSVVVIATAPIANDAVTASLPVPLLLHPRAQRRGPTRHPPLRMQRSWPDTRPSVAITSLSLVHHSPACCRLSIRQHHCMPSAL